MFIEDAKRILRYNEDLITLYQKIIKNSPNGSLVLRTHPSKKQSLYIKTSFLLQGVRTTKLKAVTQETQELAMAIKRKQFCMKSLPILKKNVSVLQLLIERYLHPEIENITPFLGSGYTRVPLVIYGKPSTGNALWEGMKERKNTSFADNLKFDGPGGKYRSKSEVIIAMELARWGIDFKYETALILKKRTVYPDFVILKPKSEELFYWEHAGMIDVDEYSESLWGKLREYKDNNIFLGQNLIVTTEGDNFPLSFLQVEDIIKTYLLPS